MRKPAPSRDGPRKLRVAIYTRKSTEEGLEQEFNSLDAQREACAAYVASQRHEGWSLVPDIYDDGGFSGGSMERPALKALLAEVAAGRIHVIIVYKVDRLTRSLSDFARIVDVLDTAGASFVSVTQSFNTTTSMGRLTLNMLLSFAQFEREVTAERIRDKIAASKARGMYMGGAVPLGYDRADRKLVINQAEADTVRFIYRRYLELGSGHRLLAELNQFGMRSKARAGRDGRAFGAQPITRGPLYVILQNRIYVGEVVHKGNIYPGQHQAILERDLFDAVQHQLASARVERKHRTRAAAPSLLAGLLHDRHGRRMTPSHACKGSRRYRYYISQPELGCDTKLPVCRVPAADLEAAVLGELRRAIETASAELIVSGKLDSRDMAEVEQRTRVISSQIESGEGGCIAAATQLLSRVELHDGELRLIMDLASLHASLREPVEVLQAMVLAKTNRGVRLVIPGAAQRGREDEALIKLVAQGHRIRCQLERSSSSSLDEVIAASGFKRDHFMTLARIGYLAPGIVNSILDGQQPQSLNRLTLSKASLPLSWSEQRRMLGFG